MWTCDTPRDITHHLTWARDTLRDLNTWPTLRLVYEYLDDVDVPERVYRLVTEEVPVCSEEGDRLDSFDLKNHAWKSGLRIRIYFILIRIQHFRLNTDPDPDPIWIQGFNDEKVKKITAENFLYIKNYNLPIPRPP
jgi:hypothetical protein